MEIPEKIKPFVTGSRWKKLRLDDLEAEDRNDIVDIIEAGFSGSNPDEIDDEAVDDVLRIAQGLSDSFHEEIDEEMPEADLKAAGMTADAVVEEMNGVEE